MHHSLVSPFGILCLLLSSAYAREWSVSTFPNPNTSSGAEACHRGSAKGFICDPDRFLSVESADVVSVDHLADKHPEEGTEQNSDFLLALFACSSI